MDRFTRGIALASARHPWRTITSWVLVLGAVFVLAASRRRDVRRRLLRTRQPERPRHEAARPRTSRGGPGQALVVLAGAGRHDARRPAPAGRRRVLSDVATFDHVASVADPFRAGTISPDGRIGYARLTLDAPERELGKPAFAVLSDAVSPAPSTAGLRVELGGDAVFLNAEDESSGHVGIGLLVALLVLLVVFGTVVAARRPDRPRRSSRSAPASAASPCWPASMDVSVVRDPDRGTRRARRRHRLRAVRRRPLPGEPRAPGRTTSAPWPTPWARPERRSSSPAAPSSSRLPPSPSPVVGVLTSIGLATSLMVLFAVAAAITLLPALLSLLGDRIDTGRLVRRHRPAKRAEETAWWRFGHRVSGRPWPYLLGAVVALLAVAAPALGMQTAFPAAGDAPTETTPPAGLRPARRGLRHRDQRTADGRRRPRRSPASTAAGVPALAGDIAAVPGIASVGDAATSPPTATPSVFTAMPTTGPADPDDLRRPSTGSATSSPATSTSPASPR